MGGSSGGGAPAQVKNAPTEDWEKIQSLLKASNLVSSNALQQGQGVNQSAIDLGQTVADTSINSGSRIANTSVKLGNNLIKAALKAPPEVRTADVSALQETAKRQAELNGLNRNALEESINPDVAAARKELASQISGDLAGGPSTELSNLWLKKGLADIIATGASTDSGFAHSALADSTRSDYIADRTRLQGNAAALLAANPQQDAGIDPGSLAQLEHDTKGGNMDARDAFRASILAALGNQANNVVGSMKAQSDNVTGSVANQANTVVQAGRDNANATQQAGQQGVQNALSALQQRMQAEASVNSQNAQAQNAASAGAASNSSATTGALIGGGAAIAGAVILAF